MKKLMSVMLMMISLGAFASVGEVVTNYVYVVSNQYFRTFEVHEVTNKVKNTHINYYTTNYETKVVQVANLTYKTNVTILADVSQQAIIAASNQANRAAEQVEYARQSAYDSASSASEASWYESQAHMFCDNAASKVYEVNRIGDEKISAMNAKQTWFDNNYGKLITNYNYYSVNKLVANGENIYGVHRYVLYINGVRQPDYWVEIDFSQYSAAYSGGQCWAYTVWRQSPKNNTSNHSYVYSRTMHTSYAGGLIRDERSAFNKFTMLTTNGGYAQGYFYQGALNNPRNAYPARVLTHYKYSGYEYRIDDDPKWYVYGDLRIVDQETGESVDRLVTSNSLANAFARVATTGSYNDLNNKPTLSTVATTGSYNDLNNRPDSDYAARFSSLEGHEVTVNDELVYLKKRLAVLEAFHSVVPPPDPHPDPEPEKQAVSYVYNVIRNGAQFGTITVDVKTPTRVASEWTDTYFYQYSYRQSWTGAPSLTKCQKGFPKAGYTWQPWCWMVFQSSNSYQIQSRNTGNDEHTFYTGQEQFTYGGSTYVVALDHIVYE